MPISVLVRVYSRSLICANIVGKLLFAVAVRKCIIDQEIVSLVCCVPIGKLRDFEPVVLKREKLHDIFHLVAGKIITVDDLSCNDQPRVF